MYVIQERWCEWDKWDTCPPRYATIKEAKGAFDKAPKLPAYRRIAEEYTVVRYKAVKLTDQK